MNNSSRIKIAAYGWLLLLLASVPRASYGEHLDIVKLYGQQPPELAKVFPGATNAEAGQQWKIANWRGWKTVYLSLNLKKRLVSISFVPITPLSVQRAQEMLSQEFGLTLPRENEVNAPALIAYRNLKGKISTINLSYVNWRTDKRIGEIGVFFRLAWEG